MEEDGNVHAFVVDYFVVVVDFSLYILYNKFNQAKIKRHFERALYFCNFYIELQSILFSTVTVK